MDEWDALKIVSVAGDESEGDRWSLHVVALIAGYAAALVSARSVATVRTFTFPQGSAAAP